MKSGLFCLPVTRYSTGEDLTNAYVKRTIGASARAHKESESMNCLVSLFYPQIFFGERNSFREFCKPVFSLFRFQAKNPEIRASEIAFFLTFPVSTEENENNIQARFFPRK